MDEDLVFFLFWVASGIVASWSVYKFHKSMFPSETWFGDDRAIMDFFMVIFGPLSCIIAILHILINFRRN
jgi:hypothetical protein